MGLHHMAFATKDLTETHRFYTELMGFQLVTVERTATPGGTGWAKHAFYDAGDGSMIAFWELHDPTIPDTWSPAISEGMGLPPWVNHIAFAARDRVDLDRRRQTWVDAGAIVAQVDHEWCESVYTQDPNRILVEFCWTKRPFTEADVRAAQVALVDPTPATAVPKEPVIYGL